MRLLIVVTHLLGTGHLARATALGEAAAAAGHDVTLVSGGMPAPHLARDGVRLVQLPPLRSDGTAFTRLLSGEGRPATDEYLLKRRRALLTALDEAAPGGLVTELFPFGRRVLAGEFEALLQAAKSRPGRPRIFASIRDVLAPPSKPAKAEQTERRLRAYYDGVLVHGDPSVMRLEQSWPITAPLRAMLSYTGFVAPALPETTADGDGAGEILVTAGGGPVGQHLFETAVAAAARLEGPHRTWRLLIGGDDRQARIDGLRENAPPWVIIEPVRPDFRELLQRAALSVNQAGYNTILDVAAARIPSVIVPFEDAGETEQAQRAACFAERYGYRVLPERELTPETLATAMEAALKASPPSAPPPDLSGAARSVALLAGGTTAALT
ncbi:MAG: glycosyltransferase [Pseudomonadota bacterium]